MALKLSLKHGFKQFKETQKMAVENLLFSNSVEKRETHLIKLIWKLPCSFQDSIKHICTKCRIDLKFYVLSQQLQYYF